MPQNIGGLILAAGLMFGVLAGIAALSNFYTLNIKAKTVGNGQHGTAGVGKTAYWLYPCIEYALASGMSFLTSDTKGVRPDRVQ